MTGEAAALDFQWPPLDARPCLARGVVHLVAVRLPEEIVCGADRWALLSEAEARRARRLKFDDHRNRWVAGRGLLKELLGRYMGVEPGAVRLRVGEIGKPYLADPAHRDFFFNYTDSHGCLVYAFSRGVEVGVDLEKLPRPTRYVRLAQRKLTSVEFAAFERIPEHRREEAFLASWTRKEAYGKALGVGVRYPMAEVTLCEDFGEPRYVVRGDNGSAHALAQFRPPFPGIACVVAASAEFELETYSVEFDSCPSA